MKPAQSLGAKLADQRWRARTQFLNTSSSDPFAVNPIRRAAALVVVCLVLLVGPWLISEEFGISMMLFTGWIAITGLVLGLPIFVWCVGEWIVSAIRRRTHPGIDQLGLSPRIEHILARHGFTTIRELEETPDDGLLLLSNLDQRGVQEIRRSVTLWKYRRWQESGFSAITND
jgi:hypothetical protein